MPSSGFPHLLLQLVILDTVLFIFQTFFRICNQTQIHAYTQHTHTYTQIPGVICCVLSPDLLYSLRNTSWSFFHVKYSHSV